MAEATVTQPAGARTEDGEHIGLTALEMVRLVREGAVRPVELVAEHLDRISAADPAVGAFQVVRGERALDEARALEARQDWRRLPLAGVPVAIKDNVDVAGEPTRDGSLGSSPAPVAQDAELVRRLRASGCVVVGKTRVPELCIWPWTESAFGITRNPWNLGRTPGGSSGGSAAAVSAAMVPIALGSDGGGSIRIPSACCGLFGLKPGRGVIDTGDGHDWYGMSTSGPLATTVADAAAMLAVLTDGRIAPADGATSRLRLALSMRMPARGVRADGEVAAAVEACGELLAAAGHTVIRSDPPYSQSMQVGFTHRYLAGIAQEAAHERLDVRLLEPRTRRMVGAGRRLAARFPVPSDGDARWRRRLQDWFAGVDVLLMPTMAHAAVATGRWAASGWVRASLGMAQWVPATAVWNLVGFPAASVPAGLTGAGLPIGLQLVAAPGGEPAILAVAGELERLRPWSRHPRTGAAAVHAA